MTDCKALTGDALIIMQVRLNDEQMRKLQNLAEFFQCKWFSHASFFFLFSKCDLTQPLRLFCIADFDDDGNGTLSHDEFEAMVEHMKSTGLDMSKHNFTVESVDKNNDGAIKFNEFLAMMSALSWPLPHSRARARAARCAVDIGALDSVGSLRPVHG